MKLIKAPWTNEQVRSLKEFQRSGTFHAYTCGNFHSHHPIPHSEGGDVLIPTPDGWVCEVCDYTQDSAQDWTLDFRWKLIDV